MITYPDCINLKKVASLALVLMTISCEPSINLQTFQLNFHASANNSAINCHQPFQLSDNNSFYINDLRFYVSDIFLINVQQQQIQLQLIQDKLWQYQTTALLDFEDASNHCQGTTKINTVIKGLVPTGTYEQLTFTIGVPFLLNHQNPAFTQSPLNIGSMFWSWQNGYKFLRIDLQNDHNEKWAFHLGSTACRSAASIRPPEKACKQPNMIKITLSPLELIVDNSGTKEMSITFNLDRLLKNLPLNQESRCLSTMDNEYCDTIFKRLGLNIKSGQCNKHCEQQIFTTKMD